MRAKLGLRFGPGLFQRRVQVQCGLLSERLLLRHDLQQSDNRGLRHQR